MMQPIVRFEDVSKSFGQMKVVENLNLTIEPGQFVTLLGPSGCGKSTTLRMLAGFEVASRGRIFVEGIDVTKRPPERRNTNMVFQDYALFSHMTVRQNISFGLERKRWDRSRIRTRVDQLLDMLQIAQCADRRPDALSGGQRQRVALGRALAPDPAVLLLDEPLAALDAKLRAAVQVELKELQKRTGKTFIFVTHDQDEALTMSDRVIVMRNGAIEQDGTPREIYQRPRSRFVAEFIGETNVLEGLVVASEKGPALDWRGVRLQLANGPVPGNKGAVSIRPEALRIIEETAAADIAIEGEIVGTTYRGDHQLVAIRVGADDRTINMRVEGGNSVPPSGRRVRLACAHDDAVWLSTP